MLWKPGQWKWQPVRHTEDQQHPDWVLFYNAEDGQAPRAVAQCERRADGQWEWIVDEAMPGAGRLVTVSVQPSADLAMKEAVAFIKKGWEEKADA